MILNKKEFYKLPAYIHLDSVRHILKKEFFHCKRKNTSPEQLQKHRDITTQYHKDTDELIGEDYSLISLKMSINTAEIVRIDCKEEEVVKKLSKNLIKWREKLRKAQAIKDLAVENMDKLIGINIKMPYTKEDFKCKGLYSRKHECRCLCD